MLFLDLFCASVCKMRPEVSERPKRGYFLALGMLRFFHNEVMVITSLLLPFRSMKGFMGKFHLQVWERNLYCLFKLYDLMICCSFES